MGSGNVAVIVKIHVLHPVVDVWYIFIPKKKLRAYPCVIRGTNEWDNTYKVCSVIEQTTNHLKDNLGVAERRTQNEKTLHAGITQLVTVLLADKIHHHKYIRSLKPLIA